MTDGVKITRWSLRLARNRLTLRARSLHSHLQSRVIGDVGTSHGDFECARQNGVRHWASEQNPPRRKSKQSRLNMTTTRACLMIATLTFSAAAYAQDPAQAQKLFEAGKYPQ